MLQSLMSQSQTQLASEPKAAKDVIEWEGNSRMLNGQNWQMFTTSSLLISLINLLMFPSKATVVETPSAGNEVQGRQRW